MRVITALERNSWFNLSKVILRVLQQLDDFLTPDRMTKQVALRDVAAAVPQKFELALGFYAFRDGFQTKTLGQ